MSKPKRYYITKKVDRELELTDALGNKFKVSLTCKEQGIVGVLAVFTNKKKARKWCKHVAEAIEIEEG